MFVDFLENHFGTLKGLSTNEKDYSTGSWSRPDVVFRQFGIEVKRVEFLTRHRIGDRDFYYAHLNNVSLLHESWDDMKTWCQKHKKKPALIVVLTCGRQDPIFVGFNQAQVDALQKEQRHKVWVQMNAWTILREGIMLTDLNLDENFGHGIMKEADL